MGLYGFIEDKLAYGGVVWNSITAMSLAFLHWKYKFLLHIDMRPDACRLAIGRISRRSGSRVSGSVRILVWHQCTIESTENFELDV